MGEPNGVVKGRNGSRLGNNKANGQAPIPRRPARPARKSWRARIVNNVLRFFVWYAIATILFRCPSTAEECDDDSPTICNTYFQAKSAVAPHIEPYFDEYAAPYVEIASPYATAVSENFIKPTRGLVVRYGAPRWAQAQAYVQAQWLKSGKPQVDRLQTAANEHYQAILGPHVERASNAIAPYVEVARTSAFQTYYEIILPTYDLAKPYIVQTYDAACVFTTEIAIPSVSWTFNRTYVFLDDHVLPHIRAVYAENVEPQLIRIGERLGRYKGSPTGHSKKSAATSRDPKTKPSSSSRSPVSEFKKPSPPVKPSFEKAKSLPKSKDTSSKSDRSSESSTSTQAATADADNNMPAPKEKPSKEEIKRIARETVAEDLELWQTKFATAADEGAAEIEEKVNRISQQFQEARVDTTGPQLLSQLERVSHEKIETLKKEIVAIVEKRMGQEAVDTDASAEVIAAVRRAGLAIKSKAEEVRNWREEFEQEIHEEVTGAAQQHFKILGSIRDLALQKIGMKWAWMDGITYKDWAKYHGLKRKFEEWTEDLQQLIVTNPSLEAVMDAAGSIEDRAMEIAQGAAAELGRLKEVAGWKLIAGDATDNFDSEAMQAAAESVTGVDEDESAGTPTEESEETASEEPATHEPAEQAGEVVDEPTAEGATLSEKPDEQSVQDGVPIEPAAAVDAVDDATTVPELDKEASASASASADADAESAQVKDEHDDATESGPSAVVAEGEKEEELIGSLQSPVVETLPVIVENVTEAMENTTPEEEAEVETGAEETKVEVEVEFEAEAEAEAPTEEEIEDIPPVQPRQDTASVKSALFGAAAEAVPGRQIVLDDVDENLTDRIASATAMVQAAYSSAVSRASAKYSMAMSVVSAQASETPKPVHEALFSSVSSAYSSAVASASSQMSQALDAVTKAAWSTPTPTPAHRIDWAAIESMANEKLEEGRVWAEQRYESAKIVLGLATPTPTSNSEKLLQQAKMNYYAGLGFAHSRYTEFMLAASSALSSLTATSTPTPTNIIESASSMASVAGESAASAVKAVKDSVNSVVGEAENAVAQSWEVVISHISVQIYGAPTPTAWYDGVYNLMGSGPGATETVTNAAVAYAASATNMAAEQYSAVSSIVSDLILGKDPPYTESIFSRLHSVYTAGLSMADAATSAVSSAASVATEAVKGKVDHMGGGEL